MSLVKWKDKDIYDPWADLSSLQEEINNLFKVTNAPSTTGLFDRNVSPAIDVVETDESLTIICELPGMDENEIDVSITANTLTIKGEKKELFDGKKGKYFKRETWSGGFQRTLSLPADIDSSAVEAHLEEGILKVNLPKKEEAKPKQISVQVH
ncbi:Hsp20/alpha crystallin family protein [Oceanispirochaeta crateris]|uniref:Hsp20/alpha crystallin family protein n=1 Tax=Oceanispirochaeta crateris TaxID=2518645 RepID=A0A5C1QJ01_9SPIO|nr:Hsp20/alpha crystallin family protein [Oceanispirochaeta crateris]QEN06544.1 Hsp20/alpha crystallin family protein [Oceanispirochaeta crateris]